MSDTSDDDWKRTQMRQFQQLHLQSIPGNVDAFLKTGDPYFALSALRNCLNAEEAVPRPIADWLLSGIRDSLLPHDFKTQAKLPSLGVALGLEGGAGKSNARRRVRARRLREEWHFHMRVLLLVGAKVTEAAALVEAQLEKEHTTSPVSAESMVRVWTSGDLLPTHPDQHFPYWLIESPVTPEVVKLTLSHYPDTEATRSAKAAIVHRMETGRIDPGA